MALPALQPEWPTPGTTAAPLAMVEGGYRLSTAEFDRIRSLIHQRAGIHLQAGKEAMVHSRLSRRLRETGQPSFSAYLDALQALHGAARPGKR
jgi:chemotaxis protein methyltransferase CheR